MCDCFFSGLILACPLVIGLGQAPLVAWNRDKEPDVVQELLRDSSDKAYGKKVLTWDGEPSAVSQDAIKDSRSARVQTVVDDWDEEFDRGKVWWPL